MSSHLGIAVIKMLLKIKHCTIFFFLLHQKNKIQMAIDKKRIIELFRRFFQILPKSKINLKNDSLKVRIKLKILTKTTFDFMDRSFF